MYKLSLEQADLAFDILDKMQEKFPDNPELTVDVLKVILLGVTSVLVAQEDDNGQG